MELERQQLSKSIGYADRNNSKQIASFNRLPEPQGQIEWEEIYFKIKKTTAFKKLMDTYCQRANLNATNVRFLFEGQRITETQTPKDLNMENNDEIDVLVEQFGG